MIPAVPSGAKEWGKHPACRSFHCSKRKLEAYATETGILNVSFDRGPLSKVHHPVSRGARLNVEQMSTPRQAACLNRVRGHNFSAVVWNELRPVGLPREPRREKARTHGPGFLHKGLELGKRVSDSLVSGYFSGSRSNVT